MKKRVNILALAGAAVFLLLACGPKFGMRHFAGPIQPQAQQIGELQVDDDRSITFAQGRLEVNLRPLTNAMLNRQMASFASTSTSFYKNPYETDVNPYTYEDWVPPEQSWPTTRFTVFNLKVKNYEFPKVHLNPANITLVTSNGRTYQALSPAAMVEYYWPYAVAYAGNTFFNHKQRKDILIRTMYKDDEFIFSGQEYDGYVVFPPLHKDVEAFQVIVEDVSLRFDYRDEPTESVDIAYKFQREVYVAREPRQVAE